MEEFFERLSQAEGILRQLAVDTTDDNTRRQLLANADEIADIARAARRSSAFMIPDNE